MSIYTVIDDPKIDALIQNDINLCVDEILKSFTTNIASIFLIGGFGRGEGGVTKIDGNFLPKNNYDLLLVLNRTSSVNGKRVKESLEEIKQRLLPQLNIPLEVSHLSETKFAHPELIMIYKDIYNSSKLIYGADLRRSMPSYISSPLPKSEASKIMRNRGMLVLAKLLGEQHIDYTPDERQTRIWLAKAIIGFGDAILILKEAYKTNYVDKMNEMINIDCKDVFPTIKKMDKFKSYHKESSEFRLYDTPPTSSFDIDEILTLLKDVYVWTTTRVHSIDTLEWSKIVELREDRERNILKIARNILLNIREFGAVSNPLSYITHPRDKLTNSLPYLLFESDEECLDSCRKIFNMSSNSTLKDLRRRAIEIYVKYLV